MCGLFGWFKFENELSDKEITDAKLAPESRQHPGPADTRQRRQPTLDMRHHTRNKED